MINDISKSICDTIYQAVEKKNITANKDMTYLCTVTEVYPGTQKTYRLTYEDTDYTVTLNNINPKLYDKVHLVIPQGDFSKKYVLEDVCRTYAADSGATCPPESYPPATQTTEGLMSAADKKKLDGIEPGSQANVQADWNEPSPSSDSYIKNKPASLPASDVHEWAKAETKPEYTKGEIGLGKVPNVTTDNQTPSFTQAASREDITSGDKLSVLFGKIKKWFSDLKNVAFSGSYNDLSDKPAIPTKTSQLINDSGFKTTDNDTIYTHPTTPGHKHIPAGGTSGQILRWSEDGTAVWGADNNTTYSDATTSARGLMSAADKQKLDGIEPGSQANVQADWNEASPFSDSYIKNKPASLPASDVHEWAKAETKPEYTKEEIGLGNVPNVTTDNQTPSFTQAASREDITSGDKLSVLFGKIKKWFSDLKNVAFSGSYNDLSDKPAIPTKTSQLINDSGFKTTDNDTIYTHPTTPGHKHIPAGGTSGQILRWSEDGTAVWGADNNTTYSDATTSARGLMSAADKKKLDGIATGANNYSLPAASSTVRGGVKTGYTQNGKNYPVQLSNEQMYVNVPWTDTNTDTNTWKANTKDSEGYVAKGSGQANKVWKTDENGNPAWRDENESAVSGVKGNKETEYRTGNINLTAENIGALPTAGGTVNGLLTTAGGTMVAHETGQLGTEGLINFATITTKKSSYANHPIIFNISGRGRQGSMKVTVVFHNNNSGKPDVNIFTQEGDCSYPVYMAIDATNTTYNKYKLYVRKSEAYGDVSVFASHDCSDGAFDIIYPNEQVSELPTGFIKAKTGGKVKESDTAVTLYGGDANNDLRNEPTTPNDYNSIFKSAGIKTKEAIGETDGSPLTQVIGYRAWPNSTGGKAHELGFTGNGNLYHRAGSATAWEDWREIAHVDSTVEEAVNADTVDGKHASDLQNYNNLTNKPAIPTKTSQLTNDSGFKTTDNNTWKANTKDSEGYVAKGLGQANKVWKTDADGNPAWRDDVNTQTITGVKGNAESSYRTGNVNLTAENIGALPVTGGTVSGEASFTNGTKVGDFSSGQGLSGYIHLCQIVISDNYMDQPIELNLIQRGGSGEVHIKYINMNNKDPEIDYFRKTGNIKAYIVKSSASTWDLYIKKLSPYDSVTVTQLRKGAYMKKVAVVWKNSSVASLPSEYTEATGYTSEMKEVTQKEYDALPSSKINDNIIYFIKD